MMNSIKEKYPYTELQRYYSVWLKIFFIGCLVNTVAIYLNNTFEVYFFASMLIPFVHCGIIFIALLIHSIGYEMDEDQRYIKENYPKIWKNLHPLGDGSRNNFADIQFLRGKYDDGTDERLNKIKHSLKTNTKLVLGTFFLVPIVWLINILAFLLHNKLNGV